jgi:hypothetical protein
MCVVEERIIALAEGNVLSFGERKRPLSEANISMYPYHIPPLLRELKELCTEVSVPLLCLLLISMYGCATTPSTPEKVGNICEIFRGNKKWYRAAHASYKRWGVPIPIMMAIVHQESRFTDDAKPPRSKCLCILPGPRPSSAYGYAQAGKEAWKQYQESTGNTGADRDNFEDAIDFVGWYCHTSHVRCGISKDDAYHLYLAYHEGHGGFIRKTYKKKGWLIAVAQKVKARANTYKGQLASCEMEFKRRPCCCFFWLF